ITAMPLEAAAALPRLSTFRREELRSLVAPLRQIGLRRGETAIGAGRPAARCLLVLRGALALHFAHEGQQSVFAIIGPGGIAGEIALLDGAPEPLTALAREDTLALEIDKLTFDILARGGTTVAHKFLAAVTTSATAVLRRASAHLARLEGAVQVADTITPIERREAS
ncbi:MAG TPA: cyclic nucleotide-binding domain-containing protein, partial [Hyphomicrobiaceae bacterium]|nr:cyclic nucleotide-binding domain-containing protein [Hyphomicrobiaceae bacterium]